MDLKSELQNFKTINLEEITRGDVKVSDNIRNSVFLYNKAIESLSSGSEDIAAIELKKAISMNPQFYEAINLLGLCYSYLGETGKAAEAFDKVIKAESNSIIALNYMQRLGLAEAAPVPKGRQAKKTVQSAEPTKRAKINNDLPSKSNNYKKKVLSSAVKIGIGLAAGILISYMMFSALSQRGSDTLTPDPNTADNTVDELRAEYDARLKELQDKYDLLQQDKDNALQQADYYKASLKLYEIEKLSKSRKYEEAANMLFFMKTVDFKDAEKTKFDELYKTIMPQAAKAVYDQGYKLYNSRKYQETIDKLEKVQVYYPEFYRMDATLYYMGRSYQALQDSRSALAMFQKLVETYPNTTYAKSAKVRIKELTQNP